MKTRHLIGLPWLYARSLAASRYAKSHEFIGREFDSFGRKLGYTLIRRGQRNGIGYVINPVSLIRYFEFAFARSCLKEHPGDCLDVSSPRLFSYYVAANFPDSKIHMINPHVADIEHSAQTARTMNWRNVSTAPDGVDLLARDTREYDAIWCLSVIEHIAGEIDDSAAMKLMYSRLRPGGRLIVTTNVDHQSRDEYRDDDIYTTQPGAVAGKHFFQRWYDQDALQNRLCEPIGVQPTRTEFCGEIVPGRFAAYDLQHATNGWGLTVADAKEWNENYRRYDSLAQMPGVGVVGMLFEKP